MNLLDIGNNVRNYLRQGALNLGFKPLKDNSLGANLRGIGQAGQRSVNFTQPIVNRALQPAYNIPIAGGVVKGIVNQPFNYASSAAQFLQNPNVKTGASFIGQGVNTAAMVVSPTGLSFKAGQRIVPQIPNIARQSFLKIGLPSGAGGALDTYGRGGNAGDVAKSFALNTALGTGAGVGFPLAGRGIGNAMSRINPKPVLVPRNSNIRISNSPVGRGIEKPLEVKPNLVQKANKKPISGKIMRLDDIRSLDDISNLKVNKAIDKQEYSSVLAELMDRNFTKAQIDNIPRTDKAWTKALNKKANQTEATLGGNTNQSFLKISNPKDNPLTQEARKYKSAEEFVKAQGQTVYRGGKKLDVNKINEEGLPVTYDNKVAEQFSRSKNQFAESPAGQIMGYQKGQNIVESYQLSPNARIATRSDIPDNVFNAYKQANPLTKPEVAEPIITKWAKENGFDAIDFRTLGKTSAKEAEIKVLNPDILKTKSQLTDIWNKANKPKTEQSFLSIKKPTVQRGVGDAKILQGALDKGSKGFEDVLAGGKGGTKFTPQEQKLLNEFYDYTMKPEVYAKYEAGAKDPEIIKNFLASRGVQGNIKIKPTVEPTGPNIKISGTPPQTISTDKVKNLGNVKKLFTSGSSVLQKSGKSGKQLEGLMQNQRRAEDLMRGGWNVRIDNALKGLTSEEKASVDAVLRGEAKAINPKVAQSAAELRGFFNEAGTQAQKLGLEIKNSSGTSVPFKMKENYAPQMYKTNEFVKGARRTEALNSLIGTGQARNLAEATNLLDNFIKKNADRRFGNLERAREIDLPGFIRDPEVYAKKYAQSASKRLTEVESFGTKDSKVASIIDNIANEGGDYMHAQKVFDYTTQGAPQNKLVSGITQYNLVTQLDLAAITNATQSLNTAAKAGIINTTKGAIKGFTKEGKQIAEQAGVYDQMVNLQENSGVPVHKIVEAVMWPFQKVENFNRRTAANTGVIRAQQLAKKDVTDFTTRELTGLGIDPTKIVNGQLSKEQMITAAYEMARKTQFKVAPIDVPVVWKSPAGRLLTQYQSFSFMQTKFIRDEILKEAAKGNFAPLVRFIPLAITGSYMTNYVRNLATGRDPNNANKSMDIRAWDKWGKAFGDFATGKIIQGKYVADTFSNEYNTPLKKVMTVASTIGGPTVGKVGHVLTGLETLQSGKEKNEKSKLAIAKGTKQPTDPYLDLKRFATGEVPIVGEIAKNKLFAYPKSQYTAEQKSQFAANEDIQNVKVKVIQTGQDQVYGGKTYYQAKQLNKETGEYETIVKSIPVNSSGSVSANDRLNQPIGTIKQQPSTGLGQYTLTNPTTGVRKQIDLSTPLTKPELTGNTALDKKLVSKFNGSLTTRGNDIVSLYEDGQIDAKTAENELTKLTTLKSSTAKAKKGKKPKKIAIKKIAGAKKITNIKIAKASSLKPIKLKKIKLKSAKKVKRIGNIKIANYKLPKIKIA